MKHNQIIAIDIGSSVLRVLIADRLDKELEMIGVAQIPSRGIRRGSVIDLEILSFDLKKILEEISKRTNSKIKNVWLSLNGLHISTLPSRGLVAVSLADGEITKDDINRVLNAAKTVSLPHNRQIIEIIPQNFIVDGEEGIKDPQGMYGTRLEASVLMILVSSAAIKNLTKAVTKAGVEISGIILSGLAAAQSVLSAELKELGVAVLDIGAAISALAIYKEQNLIQLIMLPIGSGHITNDLAIGIKTDINLAEKIKLDYGICNPKSINRKEKINLAQISQDYDAVFRRYDLAKIIEARTSEIFNLVADELKKLNLLKSLPAGIVLIGGGAKLPGIVDLAKKIIKLPVQIGYPTGIKNLNELADDPAWSVVSGLALMADNYLNQGKNNLFKLNSVSALKRFFKNLLP